MVQNKRIFRKCQSFTAKRGKERKSQRCREYIFFKLVFAFQLTKIKKKEENLTFEHTDKEVI